MLHTVLRRTTVALVFGTLLTAVSPVLASPLQKNTPARAKLSAGAAQGWLAGVLGTLGSLWAAIGCDIDPHGGCSASTTDASATQDQQDGGAGIDPHGGR